MGYIEGSLTSANPGADMIALVEAELLAEGCVLHDSVVSGGVQTRCWRIPAAKSPLSQEWFLVLWCTLAGGLTFSAVPAEGWDATNKRPIRGTFYSTSSFTPDATTGSPYGGTSQILNTWAYAVITGRTTAFTYGMVVNGGGLIAGTNAQNYVQYAGQMAPSAEIKAGNDANDGYYPLVVVQGPGSTTNVLSRVYGGLGAGAWYQRMANRHLHSAYSRSFLSSRQNTVAATPARLGPDDSALPKLPNCVGTLYNCLYFNASGASSGDRFTCNGSTWAVPYCAGGLSNSPFLLKVSTP